MENEQNQNQNKQDSGLSIVEEAKKLRDEIRAENDRREKILLEEQKLQAEKLLGSSAGQPIQQQLTEEEIKKNEAIEYWKGTGIDEAIKKYEK